MDPKQCLAVRFHFKGQFVHQGGRLLYTGGSEAVSTLDRDLISVPEIKGHLEDHWPGQKNLRLYWLPPGSVFNDGGHTLLCNDSICQVMADSIDEGCVAAVYVETTDVVSSTIAVNDSAPTATQEIEEELGVLTAEPREEVEDDRNMTLSTLFAIPKRGCKKNQENKGKAVHISDDEDDSSDEDFLPGDEEESEEDEEVVNIKKKFKEYKKKLNAGQIHLDDVFIEGTFVGEENDSEGTEDSDFEDSIDEMDSEGHVMLKKSAAPRFKGNTEVPQFSIGMKFSCKQQFIQAMIAYGIAQKRLLKFIKNDKVRVRVVCDWIHCPWTCLLSCTTRSESWLITTFNNTHVCPIRKDNKLVNSKRIAAKYEKLIISNPTWKIENFKAHVQEEMFASVSIDQCKRAKKMVMQKYYDATKDQYSRIFDYQEELLRSNPGSTVVVKLDPDEEVPTFQRFYVCFAALKRGFMAGCRKVVGLDGCFFKGATNGELLVAMGRDANNQMYPIAWAVVENESNITWDWFCQLFFKDVEVGDGADWVFISDQQKGILNAVNNWAPLAEHRNCARHIYANWRKTYKEKDWQKRFWKCAKSSCKSLFNLNRAKLARETVEGARAILKTAPEHWVRAFFRLGSNCDSVDNNICESFNKWIVEARLLPIISMLEAIRRKVMVRIQEQISKSLNWHTVICPNINKKLNTYITISGNSHAISNGDNCFEVKHWDHRFTVDLNKMICSCRYWQLAGLPCPHGIACIHHVTNNLDAYVANCYSVSEFKKTYQHCLQPCEGIESWPISSRPNPLAPKYVKLPGRPRKERKREGHEKPKGRKLSKVGTVIRCRICKGTGHNKTTCKAKDQPSGSQSAANHAPQRAAAPKRQERALTKSSQQSSASNTKRKGSKHDSQPPSQRQCTVSKSASLISTSCTRSNTMLKSSAKGKVQGGGTSTMKITAKGGVSKASSSVTINVTGGSATASACILEPSKVSKPPKKMTRLCLED